MQNQIIILHGAAERDPNFASALVKNLGNPPETLITPVFYGDIFQPAEDYILEKLAQNEHWKNLHLQKPLGVPLRADFMQFTSDIFQWMNDGGIQHAISGRVADAYVPSDNVHLVCHSMGCLVAVKTPLILTPITHLHTCGNPLAIYEFPPGGAGALPWFNYFHTDDLIGSPLGGLYNCTDIEIKDVWPPTEIVGGEEAVLTLQAHNAYWNSKTMAKNILEHL